MDFQAATDGLFSRVDHEDLAKALGVSVASIRQARLKPDASARRRRLPTGTPPTYEWPKNASDTIDA